MDAITELVGVTISDYKVKFGIVSYAACTQTSNCYRIENKNFRAEFDGKKWTVEMELDERATSSKQQGCMF